MAHSLSAKKRIRQNLKRRARNRWRKELVKTQVKIFNVALGAGDLAKAEAELPKITERLDRSAVKGAMHRNTASRKRSRLARKLNAARAQSQAGGKGSGAATA